MVGSGTNRPVNPKSMLALCDLAQREIVCLCLSQDRGPHRTPSGDFQNPEEMRETPCKHLIEQVRVAKPTVTTATAKTTPCVSAALDCHHCLVSVETIRTKIQINKIRGGTPFPMSSVANVLWNPGSTLSARSLPLSASNSAWCTFENSEARAAKYSHGR